MAITMYKVTFIITAEHYHGVRSWLENNLGSGQRQNTNGVWTAERTYGVAQGRYGPYDIIFKHEKDAIWFSLTWL